MKKIRKAVFPVAGFGTRFLPATKTVPKEMLPILDKPLIHYGVVEALEAGIEEFIFITSRGKSSLEDYFDHVFELEHVLREKNKKDSLEKVQSLILPFGKALFIRQQEPLGLGHAVLCAKEAVGDEPFAVILPDDVVLSQTPCLGQMIAEYEKNPGYVLGVMEVGLDKTSSYGILDVSLVEEKRFYARALVEKPRPSEAPSRTAIVGRYVLEPSIFDILSKQNIGIGGEIQITDALNKALESQTLYGFAFDGQRFDCGTVEGMLQASIAFAMERDDLRHHVKTFLKG